MRRLVFSIIILYASWKLQAVEPDFEAIEEQKDLFMDHGIPVFPKQTSHSVQSRLEYDSYSLEESKSFYERNPQVESLSQPRFIRATKSSLCYISRNTLNDIKQSLNEIHESGVRISCELDENKGARGCKEFLNFITCAVVTSSRWLSSQASKSSKPIKHFSILQVVLSKMSSELNKNLRNLGQELGSGRVSAINNIQESIKKIQPLVEKAINESKIALAFLVVSSIGSGQIDTAIQHFKSIEADNRLSDILRQTFKNHGGTNSVDSIIAFTKKLQSCQHVRESYSTLLEIMTDQRNADSPKFVSIMKAISSSSCLVKNLQHAFDKAAQNAIKLFVMHRAKAIRTGDDMAIINSAQNDWKEIRSFETNIIQEAFSGNHMNSQRVLLFIHHLPTKEDQAYAYPVLFDEMVRSNQFNGHEILMLAYRANVLANSALNAPLAVKDKLKRIRSSLPKSIRTLLFDNFIYIYVLEKYNTKHLLRLVSGYGDSGLEDPDIITCPISTSYSSYKWNVEKLENGRYFRFKNELFKKSFGSVTTKSITVNKGALSQHEWEVIPTRNGTLFWIKNRANGRMLEAGPNPYYPVLKSLGELSCEIPWGSPRMIQTINDSNKQLWRIS